MLDLKLEKIKTLSSATQGKRFTPEELGQAAALISKAAEEEVLDKYLTLLGKDGSIYYSAVAQWSRDSDFSRRLADLDKEHRRSMIQAFRTEP